MLQVGIPSLSVCVSLCLSLYLSVSPSLSIYPHLSFSFPLPLSLSLYLTHQTHIHSIFLSLTLSLPINLFISFFLRGLLVTWLQVSHSFTHMQISLASLGIQTATLKPPVDIYWTRQIDFMQDLFGLIKVKNINTSLHLVFF